MRPKLVKIESPGFVQVREIREKIKFFSIVRESHEKSGTFFKVWKKKLI